MDSAATPPSVLVLLATGAEEMETVIPIDVLRRAEIDVVVAGVDGDEAVECSRGVRIVPDTSLAAVLDSGRTFDWILLPGGGPGSERLASLDAVGGLLREQEAEGRHVAAICAAPRALSAHGVFAGVPRTSHPSVTELVLDGPYREDAVVTTDRLVTSRGPGTAFAFAFALVERMRGAAVAAAVRAPMMFATGSDD